MEGDRAIGIREVWLSWIDDENKQVSGYVMLLEQTSNYLKFKTNRQNIITISYNRLVKMKERGGDANDYS